MTALEKFCKMIFILAIGLDVVSVLENATTLFTSNDAHELRISKTGLFLDAFYLVVSMFGISLCEGGM